MKADEPEILAIFAQNLRRYRKEKHLSQEQLADLASLHRTYIGMLERCEKNITIGNLEKIARALRVEAYLLIKND